MSVDHASRSRTGPWLLAALLAATSPTAAFAQKKLPPPPPPAGMIFFSYNSQTIGMRADGSGKNVVFSPALRGQAVPSSLVYGTNADRDRIWLAFAGTEGTNPDGSSYSGDELFAYKALVVDGQLTVRSTRITKLNPTYRPNPTVNSIPSWSNGGDLFISLKVVDLTPPNYPTTLVRACVSGADINAALAAGVNLDLDASAFGTGVLEVVATTPTGFEQNLHHHGWSPDGTSVAFGMQAPDRSVDDAVFVKNLTTGVTQEVFRAPWQGYMSRLVWSPDGSKIAAAKNGSIHTFKPDGTGYAVPFQKTSSIVYTAPAWSPDSTQLGFEIQKWAGGAGGGPGYKYNHYVARALATGGSQAILTSDLEELTGKSVYGWCPSP
jgi:hypothetical protein